MENASKALLMAAGVLLGILLLSVMIYVFRQGARVQQTYDQKQITNQLELYNSKFEKYDRDNNILTAELLENYFKENGYYEWYYQAYNRAVNTKTPSLMCENESYYERKFGTITSDEVLLAGTIYGFYR